jgi:hypothetical protein
MILMFFKFILVVRHSDFLILAFGATKPSYVTGDTNYNP